MDDQGPANNRLGLVGFTGADAQAFIGAQFSSDVKTLAVGEGQWSAWLNPQGRVRVFFPLFRTGEDAYVAAIAFGRAEAFAQELRRFVFRRKVAIQAVDDLVLGHGPGAPADACARLPYPAGADRSCWLAPAMGRQNAEPGPEELDAGLPFLSGIVDAEFVAHALGLKRLGAISVSKGCYPGQEIVARTHFLGRNKRALCLVGGLADEAPGTVLTAIDDGSPAGAIAARCEGRGLAVLVEPEAGAELRTQDGTSVKILKVFSDS